jgi:hypothetical protein
VTRAAADVPPCDVAAIIPGPPKHVEFDIGDPAYVKFQITNGAVSYSPATGLATATKTNQALSTSITIWTGTSAGAATACDPRIATVTSVGRDRELRLHGVPEAEHLLSITNDPRGLTEITALVNHTAFRVPLTAGLATRIDIASAMHRGNQNTVVLIGMAHKRGSADVVLS